MVEISDITFDFLLSAYESTAHEFFDDPVSYTSGNSVKEAYEELKSLGKELGYEYYPNKEELCRVNDLIKNESTIDQSVQPTTADEACSVSCYGTDVETESMETLDWLYGEDMGVPDYNNEEDNKEVELKLSKLSDIKKTAVIEIIGEWTTYDLEE
jgi:hypothetical protein